MIFVPKPLFAIAWSATMEINEIDDFVLKFGEKWRTLIADSLRLLEEKEPGWDLPTRMDKAEFLRDLISKVNLDGQSKKDNPV